MEDNPFFSLVTNPDGLVLAGELDTSVADQVRIALDGFAGRTAVIDCAGLTFMDSSGMRAMVRSRAAGVDVRLTNCGPGIRRIFEILSLTDFIVD